MRHAIVAFVVAVTAAACTNQPNTDVTEANAAVTLSRLGPLPDVLAIDPDFPVPLLRYVDAMWRLEAYGLDPASFPVDSPARAALLGALGGLVAYVGHISPQVHGLLAAVKVTTLTEFLTLYAKDHNFRAAFGAHAMALEHALNAGAEEQPTYARRIAPALHEARRRFDYAKLTYLLTGDTLERALRYSVTNPAEPGDERAARATAALDLYGHAFVLLSSVQAEAARLDIVPALPGTRGYNAWVVKALAQPEAVTNALHQLLALWTTEGMRRTVPAA